MWLESCERQIPVPYWVVFPESMSAYTWVRFVHLKQPLVWNLNMDQTRSTVCLCVCLFVCVWLFE